MRIIIVLLVLTTCFSTSCSNEKNNFIIDFEGELNSIYTISNIEQFSNYSTFQREGLDKIRPDWLLGGVKDQDIELHLNLSPGRYTYVSYLEGGLTDSAFLKLIVDEREIDFDWQYFNPPAEGRNSIQNMYRIITFENEHSIDGIKIKYIGEVDSVRLLALGIYPHDSLFTKPRDHMISSLKEIGNIESNYSTLDIKRISDELLSDENRSFDVYVNQKLEEFSLAIDLFNMMGWEKGIEEYGLGLFDRLHQSVMLFDGIVEDPFIGKYLKDRAIWYRGRLLWWLDKERGGKGEERYALRDLKYLNQKFPNNKIIRMYLGEKIDIPDPYDNLEFDVEVPEWSRLQYEAIGRLTAELKWWVEERQSENGELGGKIGDDVEILRWWSALAAFGDTNTIKGWKKLSDAVWNNPKVYKGYSKRPIDVEHASEYISDAFPEMIYFNGDESEKFLKPSADYFMNLWTFKNNFGRRFFKSSWFSSTEVILDPPKDRDLAMNTRAAKAVRYYAWKTGAQQFLDGLYEWSNSWKEMALKTDKGKAAGIFPASVRGIDEEFNGDGNNWYDADMFWRYFNWRSSGGVGFYDQLLFSYITHRDETLLDPLKLTLDLVEKYGDRSKTPAEGSEEWAAQILARKYDLWNTVFQYRVMTKDKSYDHLIIKYGTPYSKYIVTKDEKYITDGMYSLLSEIRYNTPLRTEEVIHTDRVRTSGIITLKGMLTGNDTYGTDSPFLAVTYKNTTNDLTFLVKENKIDSLRIKVYSHSDEVLNPIIKVWLLDTGKYDLLLKSDTDIVIMKKNIEIRKRGEEIQLEIPSKTELELSLIKL